MYTQTADTRPHIVATAAAATLAKAAPATTSATTTATTKPREHAAAVPVRTARSAPEKTLVRPQVDARPAAPTVSAQASCGERHPLSMAYCLRTTCAKPSFASDPSCVKLADADRRQQETMQRY